ncbi:hypothetical protein AUP68_02885 [Ilyonectria robusta]
MAGYILLLIQPADSVAHSGATVHSTCPRRQPFRCPARRDLVALPAHVIDQSSTDVKLQFSPIMTVVVPKKCLYQHPSLTGFRLRTMARCESVLTSPGRWTQTRRANMPYPNV